MLESVAYAGEEIEQITPEGMPLQFPKTGNFLGVVGNRNSIELVGARKNLDMIKGIERELRVL